MKSILNILFLLILSLQFNYADSSENLYLGTDREVYYPGEKIYLKIWYLNNNRTTNSDHVFVELLSAENDIIEQKIVLTREHGAALSFDVSSALPSGFYLLRAYTAGMQKYGPEYFAYRKIMIINPAIDNRFNYPAGKNFSGKTLRTSIYPEGGNVIKGIRNRIFLQFENLPENGLEGGYVMVNESDTVCQVVPVNDKIAYIDFIPYNEKYRLRLPALFPHRPITVSNISDTGLKLGYREGFRGLFFTISRTDTLVRFDDLKIKISNLGDDHKPEFELQVGPDIFIEFERIHPGMNYISLVSEDNKEYSYLYYFKTREEHFNIEMENNNGSINPGDTARLEIKTISPGGDPVPAILNVVIKRKSSSLIEQPEIRDYFRIADLLHVHPEIHPVSDIEKRAINCIYGSYFTGDKNFRDEGEQFKYQNNYAVNGSLNNGVFPGQNIYFSFPADSSQLFISEADTIGRFSFPVSTIYGRHEIFIKTEDSIQDGFLSLENQFYPDFIPLQKFPRNIDSTRLAFINDFFLQWKIRNKHTMLNHKRNVQVNSPLMYYDKADFYISMDNYVELPNMEEVFFEIVRPVIILRENRVPYLKVIDRRTNRTIGDRPLYMIDGIPLTDPSYVMSLKPPFVKDLAVIQRTVFIGKESFDGIIIINTRSGNFSDIEPRMSYLRQEYVFPEKKNRYEIIPQRVDDHLPFIPATAYWNSALRTDENGFAEIKFIMPDMPGSYEICIDGLDRENLVPGYYCAGLKQY